MRFTVAVVGIQSPIPLIYLRAIRLLSRGRWDSVTYPLDILVRSGERAVDTLGFSHLSP